MYHRIEFIGRMGRDPEMRYTPQGQPVTSFPVAANRTFYNAANEQVEETIWFNCTAWGKMAENIAKYGFKKQVVFVEGRIVPDKTGNPRVWTDKEGNHRSNYEVNCGMVRFLSWQEAERMMADDDPDGLDPDKDFPAVVRAPSKPVQTQLPESSLHAKMQRQLAQGPSAVDIARSLGGEVQED